ncbi:sensor histidine kinase [Bacillus carboniphilus]|uniref:histidine kinase n=1 Tax=Bacillus carboniphilus TaxID=86663 RepID=A0ABY9JX61_9BACI|nr:sensor histidine kinase [Bacillus carboniphilus]WLR43379.1 sensor histidine kinase [Bacillus carboniphilus]
MKWFRKDSGIAPYIWSMLSILPFYYFFSTVDIVVGTILTILFFVSYRLAFVSKNWPIYLWTSVLIGISLLMSILYQFIYFSFFIAYYNGHIKNRLAFIIIYIIHIIATGFSINYNIIIKNELFFNQLPFIVIVGISVILLPFNIYNKKKQDVLEEQLEDANKKIAHLLIQEERQRIARDLHDTLGQKLSLIRLKSDLANKLIEKDREQARNELRDVQQTARTALNEVRIMVSNMRGIKLKEELIHVKQILKAAQIEYKIIEKTNLSNISLFIQNILSMCLKEAVTNVVRHSQSSSCSIIIDQVENKVIITIQDNGIGMNKGEDLVRGSGLLGIEERLEFVNGELTINVNDGTTVLMSVPNVIKDIKKEV